MNRSKVLAATVVSLTLALAACSGGGTGSSATTGASSSSITDFCGSICERENTCDKTQPMQTCSSACENNNAALYPKLRADLVSSIQSCLPDKDCATVIEGSAVQDCLSEGVASLAPTPAGTAFCDAYVNALTTCDRSLDKADCLTIAKEYNDAALQDAQSCTTQSCSGMPKCVNAALDLSSD